MGIKMFAITINEETIAIHPSPNRLSDWALFERGAKKVDWDFDIVEHEREEG